MSFLVYERDPFVRTDICEALAAEFENRSVSVVDTLDGFGDNLNQGDPCLTVVMVASSKDLAAAERVVAAFSEKAKFVIICSEKPQAPSILAETTFVQKPFSSHDLIAAIRGGCSGLLA